MTILLTLLGVWCGPDAQPSFKTETLADGVYAFLRQEPFGLANHANSVLILQSDGAILVDTAFTEAATRELVETIRGLTDKPITVFINTHWHDDHSFGNSVIKKAFPQARLITQSETAQALTTTAVANRTQQVTGGPQALAYFKDLLQNNQDFSGNALTDKSRAVLKSTIQLVETYLQEAKTYTAIPADETVEKTRVLGEGSNRLELRFLGPAATEGDLLIWMPEHRLLISGDLLSLPVPSTYKAHLANWSLILAQLIKMEPVTVVPGHGPLCPGTRALEQQKALFDSVLQAAMAAKQEGKNVENALQEIQLEPQKSELLGKEPIDRFLFDYYFRGPALRSLFPESP
ncbi:MAG: MBL fold metallo-hydrolase [Acidobacteria bacterium]|nr:MBL fold metallo-hydrolase [Acidobacteriota bacterium]